MPSDEKAQAAAAAKPKAAKKKSKFSPVDDNGVQLPEGWFAAKDPAGKTYFFNKATRVTKWDRPTDAEASPKVAKSKAAASSSSSSSSTLVAKSASVSVAAVSKAK